MKQNLHIAKFRFSRRKFYVSKTGKDSTPVAPQDERRDANGEIAT